MCCGFYDLETRSRDANGQYQGHRGKSGKVDAGNVSGAGGAGPAGFCEKEADIRIWNRLSRKVPQAGHPAEGQGAAYRILSNGSERTARLSGASERISAGKNLLELHPGIGF